MRFAPPVVAFAVLSVSLSSGAAWADGDEGGARAEARELAQRGDAQFSKGRCDRAVTIWKQAEAKYHAPTILLRIARCHALMGRVVEAARTLDAIAREQLSPEAPAPFIEARKQAIEELPGVRERIGELTLRIEAPKVDVDPSVEIDDLTVARSVRVFRLDPGPHRVRVRAPGTSWEQRFALDEGERRTMVVALRSEDAPKPARTQRIVGFVMGGAGLATMAIGSYFAVSAATTASDLASVCGPDRTRCPPEEADRVDRLKAHALAADLMVGGGALLFAAGAVVVITEPKPKQEAPRIRIVGTGLGAAVAGAY